MWYATLGIAVVSHANSLLSVIAFYARFKTLVGSPAISSVCVLFIIVPLLTVSGFFLVVKYLNCESSAPIAVVGAAFYLNVVANFCTHVLYIWPAGRVQF